jgi:hypothetical protein
MVVYVDPTFFGVVSEGLEEIYFLKNEDKDFVLLKTGDHKLSAQQRAIFEGVMKKWNLVKALTHFPSLMEMELNVLKVDSSRTVPMAITANVPIGLVNYWRRLRAVLEMSREFVPEMPKDVEQLMVIWAVLSAHKIIPVILTKAMMDGGQEGDH